MPAGADDTATRLRMSVNRLARLLRQQDPGGYSPALTGALFTVAKRGPITLGELAAHEQVSPPTITKVVEKLEARGFVRRSSDAADKRICRVSATAAGRRQLDVTRSRRTEWLAARLDDLTSDERARLDAAIDVLEKLTSVPNADGQA